MGEEVSTAGHGNLPTGSIGEMRRRLNRYLSKHPAHRDEQKVKRAFGKRLRGRKKRARRFKTKSVK